jgi:intein/homing endonuclease
VPIDLKKLGGPPPELERRDVNDLVASPYHAPRDWQSAAPPEMYPSRFAPVTGSADLDRIVDLERRPQLDPKSERAELLIEMMTKRWGRGERQCACADIDSKIKAGKRQCLKRLNAIQAWALYETGIVGGCMAFAAVGAGKCLSSTAEVFDTLAGRRRSVAEPGALEVTCIGPNGDALTTLPATCVPSGSKPCVRVLLRDGSEVEASTDHPILTSDGWADAETLRPGDFVAVASEMPDPAVVTSASDDEISLIGLLLGDGGVSQHMMGFTNMNETVIAEFRRCATIVCAGSSEHPSGSRARQFTVLGAPYTGFRDRWALWGLSKEKRMHPDLWGLPRRQVALLLNRLWACDGHIAKNNLEFTLASEKLIDDFRFMLLRLGVRSRKKFKQATCNGKQFPAWRLTMAGADALRFLDEVGDVLGAEDACREYRARHADKRRNTNTNVVPIGYAEFQRICDEICLKRGQPGFLKERGATALKRAYGVTQGQYLSREAFARFCREQNYTGHYSALLIDGVAWERVESVTPTGVQPVYDLSVPGPSNFVANGIVVHNTILDVLLLLAFKEFDPTIKDGLLLVPVNLVEQLMHEYRLIREHFVVPEVWYHDGSNHKEPAPGMPVLHVRPYSLLSGMKYSDWIRNLNPRVIIGDEADKLRIINGAGSSRVFRQFFERGNTLAAWLSGSFSKQSITEYLHLLATALRYKSPAPLDPTVGEEWDRAIGAHKSLAPPGALLRLCAPGESVRAGYGRRLAETMGVIISTGGSVDVKLTITERKAPAIPKVVADELDKLRETWVRPDGEELEDAMRVAEVARWMACGLYPIWIFPRKEPDEDIKEWRAARKDYFRELRQELLDRREHMDSAGLCEIAAQRFHGDRPKRDDRPEWACYAWPRWRDVKDKVKPKAKAVWIDEFLARDAAEWALENRGIVWYDIVAFGQKVAELSGLPMHGGGQDAGVKLIGGVSRKTKKSYAGEDGSRSIVCSIDSHHRGRDGLQRLFQHQLITTPFSDAAAFEQLLGRLHRQGQTDEVFCQLYAHTPEVAALVATALRRAEYAQESIPGNHQKLLMGWQV